MKLSEIGLMQPVLCKKTGTTWSEVFEIPCVAVVSGGVEQLRAMAQAGADFVFVALPMGIPVADAVARMQGECAALSGGAL